MGDGDPRVGGRRDAGGDPRHDLELDPGRAQRFALLAAAAEDERVAALEPHDALARRGRLDQPLADLLLRHRGHAGLLADVDQLGVSRAPVERARRDQAVVEDRVGDGDQLQRSRRHQPRVAGPGPDQVDDPRSRAHAAASARSRMSRAPAASRRSARSAPTGAGCVGLAFDSVADPLAAVGEADEGVDRDSVAVDSGVDADRRRAGRLEHGDDGPLGGQLAQRGLLADLGGSRRCSPRRRLAALQHQRALARRRDHPTRSGIGKAISPSRPSRRSPAAASTIASSSPSCEPAQPGVDVAVQLLDAQVRPRGEQLGAAAQAGGADPGALGHVVERGAGADPGVGRVLARRHRGDRQALGHLGRQVLGRVDADLGLAAQQRPLDPAHEARLVARLAVGGDLDQLGAAEQLGDLPRLSQGERAAAGGDAQRQVDLLAAQLGDASPSASASGSVSASRPNSSRRALTYR